MLPSKGIRAGIAIIDIDIDIDIFITPNISMRNTIQFQHMNNIKKVFKWMTIKKTIFTKVVRL